MARVEHFMDHSGVFIGDFPVASFCCGHMALELKSKLDMIAASDYNTGMRMLGDLGCCDSTAKSLYSKLQREGHTTQ